MAKLANRKPPSASPRIPQDVQQSLPRDYSTASNPSTQKDAYSSISRKRPRADSDAQLACRYTTSTPAARTWTDLGASSTSLGAASPAPLINSRYQLAGGLDTPTRKTAAQFEELNCQSESDFRRRWSSSKRTTANGSHTVLVGALDREGNGRRRGRNSEIAGQQNPGWGQYVMSTFGGIAGKMWNFCTAGAFRGFSAGGGVSYAMPIPEGQRVWTTQPLNSTPIPGQYPTDDYQETSAHEEIVRPSKRLQTSHNRDWVLVNEPGSKSASPYQQSPASPNRHTQASRPSLRATPINRRARTLATRLSSTSHAGSPQNLNRARAASTATQRSSPATSPRHHKQSPSSVAIEEDLHRYSEKRKKEMRQSDASMKRLNQQLQAMIQQGKNALATTVEVEDGFGDPCDEDEGFVDGDSDHDFLGKRW